MTKHYGIYHTIKKAYFVGFDNNGIAIWGNQDNAKPYADILMAQGQANCFRMFDGQVQRKPVLV